MRAMPPYLEVAVNMIKSCTRSVHNRRSTLRWTLSSRRDATLTAHVTS